MGDTKLGYELYEFLSRKIISGILVHFGDDQEEAAKSIANAVCDELIHEWGGAFCYIPKAVLAKLSPRNEQIFAEFNGANYGALARKYELSDMRIRQIIRAMQAKARQKGHA